MLLNPATAFQLVNLLALSGWCVLVVDTLRRRPAARWPSRWAPSVLATAYAVLVAGLALRSATPVDFSRIEGVQALFAEPLWLLAGWLHYLAFDLWVGAWMVDQAAQSGLARPAVLACLALTFLFGPAGWLAFMALRRWAPARGAAMRVDGPGAGAG